MRSIALLLLPVGQIQQGSQATKILLCVLRQQPPGSLRGDKWGCLKVPQASLFFGLDAPMRKTALVPEMLVSILPLFMRGGCAQSSAWESLLYYITFSITQSAGEPKFVTTPEYAPRLRRRRKIEQELVEDALARGWQREVERHQCTIRRFEQLLIDLGEPIDGLEATN